VLCIAQDYRTVDSWIKEFLSHFGRVKFLRPIYRELKVRGRVDFAWEIYNGAKSFYHSIAAKVLKNMLSS